MSAGPALLDNLRPRRAEMLRVLSALVEHESPSLDKRALDALAVALQGVLIAIGGETEIVANPDGGNHILARFPGRSGSEGLPTALVLGHFDTVWPSGTLAGRPFRVEDGRAYGPGSYDMKASLVIVEFALEAIRSLGLAPSRSVEVLFTSDEEIGSPSSRALIESRARAAAHVLVVEPPMADGRLKTARKGVGFYSLRIEGRSAHAGVEPERGRSAIVELAHQILRLADLADPALGTTINVGVVGGGTTPNVVPSESHARVDVRVATMDEAGRVEAAIRAIRPVTPDVRVHYRGGLNRPPMVRTAGVAALFERTRAVGRTLGLELGEGSTGGGSDANFTAALGIPTIDGLGALGGGAHAVDEHVLIDSLPERAALLAALLLEL